MLGEGLAGKNEICEFWCLCVPKIQQIPKSSWQIPFQALFTLWFPLDVQSDRSLRLQESLSIDK